jgi:hypothetical protein
MPLPDTEACSFGAVGHFRVRHMPPVRAPHLTGRNHTMSIVPQDHSDCVCVGEAVVYYLGNGAHYTEVTTDHQPEGTTP